MMNLTFNMQNNQGVSDSYINKKHISNWHVLKAGFPCPFPGLYSQRLITCILCKPNEGILSEFLNLFVAKFLVLPFPSIPCMWDCLLVWHSMLHNALRTIYSHYKMAMFLLLNATGQGYTHPLECPSRTILCKAFYAIF